MSIDAAVIATRNRLPGQDPSGWAVEIAALASRRSLGTEVSFGDETLTTKDLDTFDFAGWDIALFAIGASAKRRTLSWAKRMSSLRRCGTCSAAASISAPLSTRFPS